MKKVLLTAITAIIILPSAFAQKTVQVTMEDVKKKCENTPLKDRIRVTVTSFKVTTKSSPPELGDNMASMLLNALGASNCFTVLEQSKNQAELDAELNIGKEDGANQATALKKNSLSAQLIVNGEITEYNESSSSGGFAGFRNEKKGVRLGFIVKMIKPETREIIFQKSVDVEGKAGSSRSFSVLGLKVGKGGHTSNPALADALETGLLQAVDFITTKNKEIEYPKVDPELADARVTTLTAKGLNYAGFSSLKEMLTGTPKVKKVEPAFNSTASTFKITHLGTTDELFGALESKIVPKFDIEGIDPTTNKIDIKAK